MPASEVAKPAMTWGAFIGGMEACCVGMAVGMAVGIAMT
jgi:hypothetical protein